MSYSSQMLLLAAMFAGAAIYFGGWGLLLLWIAMDFVLTALAWDRGDPRLFGKRSDGSRSALSTVGLLPYLLLTWGTWHLVRVLSKEASFAEVRPGLWIGRRLTGREPRPATDVVLDLTCEFSEAVSHRTPNYLAYPILDGGIPQSAASLAATLRALGWPERSAYIHCAQGHGRTATVTAALLIHTGEVQTVDEALATIQAVRPAATINTAQRRYLDAAIEP